LLTPYKFDHSLTAFDRIDDRRQGAQRQFDQLSVAHIANPDPQNRRTIVARGPTKGEVSILADENRRAGKSFIPNLLVGRCQQSEIDNVNCVAAGMAQCFRQRGRKLCIDEEQQNLFRRYDGVVRLPGGKGQRRIEVSIFEIGILLKNCLSRLAGRHQAKNVSDRNAQAANTWTTMHAIGIDRYSFQEV
jgi:hypothetical protein